MSDLGMNRILELIKKEGYKLTQQRRFILEVVLKNRSDHLNVDEIYAEVKKECPEIGIATVYRTIQMLEEIGVLVKQIFDDGRTRYELVDDEDRHNHHHLYCIKCGRVIEIQDKYFDELENHIENDENFAITNHKVTFYGVCSNCRQE